MGHVQVTSHMGSEVSPPQRASVIEIHDPTLLKHECERFVVSPRWETQIADSLITLADSILAKELVKEFLP
jgi:hypothetical protein